MDEEKTKLLLEINRLKEALEWYKKTYEERSLAGIIYDKLSQKFENIKNSDTVKIKKTSSLFTGKILCIVANHNYNKNATYLKEALSKYYDTLILDSGSDTPPKNSLKLKNIYYSGLLNKAYEIAKNRKYQYLLFICSDVLISPDEAEKMFSRLSTIDLGKIGIYSPSSRGLSHLFCKNKSTGSLREVPFTEGFMFLCDLGILENICPINTELNIYGWGIDIVQAFFAKEKNKLCVIDDNVEVEHLTGTGYSRESAKLEMFNWIKTLNNEALYIFFDSNRKLVDSN